MYFFDMQIEPILKKQNLKGLIEKYVTAKRRQKQFPERIPQKPVLSPVLVQVVSQKMLSDGVNDIPCIFTCETFRTGSYLRLVSWDINVISEKIVVIEAQYLSGANCHVKHGKKFEFDSVRSIQTAEEFEENVIFVLCKGCPNTTPKTGFEDFSLDTFRCHIKSSKIGGSQELPEKRRVLFESDLEAAEAALEENTENKVGVDDGKEDAKQDRDRDGREDKGLEEDKGEKECREQMQVQEDKGKRGEKDEEDRDKKDEREQHEKEKDDRKGEEEKGTKQIKDNTIKDQMDGRGKQQEGKEDANREEESDMVAE